MLNYEKNVGNWATGYNISEEMQNPVHLLLLYEMLATRSEPHIFPAAVNHKHICPTGLQE